MPLQHIPFIWIALQDHTHITQQIYKQFSKHTLSQPGTTLRQAAI